MLAASGVIVAPVLAAGPDNPIEELKFCARMEMRDSRVNCYEDLGKRMLASDVKSLPSGSALSASDAKAEIAAGAAVAEASLPAVETSEPKQMKEDMGGYQFEGKPSDHPDNDIQARVVLCQQDRDKAWYFKFENGQVWKQVDRRTLHFKECDFPAVVSRDGFGYKLQVKGEGVKIRISRRK